MSSSLAKSESINLFGGSTKLCSGPMMSFWTSAFFKTVFPSVEVVDCRLYTFAGTIFSCHLNLVLLPDRLGSILLQAVIGDSAEDQ